MNTPVIVNEFSRGMVGDDRSTLLNTWTLLKQVDPLSRKHRATLYNTTKDGDSSSSTNQITDFLYFPGAITTSLYGLGVSSSNVQLFNKDSLTSGATWSTFANSTGSVGGIPQPGVFVQYKGLAFGGHSANGNIWKCDLSGAAFTNTATTLSAAPTCNGVVHSKDDILYMAANNIVASNNNGTWNTTALTLPSRYTIKALAEFNDYLAIACNGTDGKAVVFLWDRNSTATTLSANLDWGFGSFGVLQQVEDYLIGVTIVAGASLYPKMVFRKYLSGAGGEVFNELFASSVVGLQVISNSGKTSNRMFFAGGIEIDGTLHNGIFGIARPIGSTDFSVWIDRVPNGDTAISASSLLGFVYINDYVYVAFDDSTLGYKIKYTDSNASSFSATGYAETTYNPNMPVRDRTKNKQLKVVAVSTVPIGATGGQWMLQYKVDGGSWITVATQTTIGSVTSEYFVDASGSSFTAGREYKFRLKLGGLVAVGPVESTEIKYSYEVLDSLI